MSEKVIALENTTPCEFMSGYKNIFVQILTTRLIVLAGCLMLGAGCNSIRYPPIPGPDSDPVERMQDDMVGKRQLPVIQELGHGTGDVLPVHPVFEPPIAKTVWITGHRTSNTVYVAGHEVIVIYAPGRFAPKRKARVRVPVAPKLQDVPEEKKEEEKKERHPSTYDQPTSQPQLPSQSQVQEEAKRAAEAIAKRIEALKAQGAGGLNGAK